MSTNKAYDLFIKTRRSNGEYEWVPAWTIYAKNERSAQARCRRSNTSLCFDKNRVGRNAKLVEA